MAFQKRVAHFQHNRSTEGAHQFNEIKEDGSPMKTDEDGKVSGSFYLRKSVCPTAPDRIVVTVEEFLKE